MEAIRLTRAERVSALLTEYDTCQASATSLEQAVWQSSTILGFGALATLVAVASSKLPFNAAAIAALLSTASTFLWWKIANRWWTIQHLKFARMRHIEEMLGALRQNHYVKYVDDLYDTLAKEPRPPDSSRATNIRHHVREALGIDETTALRIEELTYQRAGPKELLRPLRWFVLGIWATYLLSLAVPSIVKIIAIWFPPLQFWIFAGA